MRTLGDFAWKLSGDEYEERSRIANRVYARVHRRQVARDAEPWIDFGGES